MALFGRKCLPQEKTATHLLLKYSFYDLQVNPMSCVRTESVVCRIKRFLHTLSEARLIAIVEVIHRSTERKLLLWKDDLKK